jgi:conjugal transfer pilus assembly protein TraK
MLKIKFMLISCLALSPLFGESLVIDNLQETKHINISRSDVNRLVFPYAITYQANSKEKDLTISVVGKEMFVKFTPSVTQEQTTIKDQVVNSGDAKIIYYKARPSEIFVVTENKTYSIVVHPKKQEATTIIFTETLAVKKEKLFENKDTEYVENITQNLLKPVMLNGNISGYEKKSVKSELVNIHIDSLDVDIQFGSIALHKGYRHYIYEFEIYNPNNDILTILDSKEILHKINKSLSKKIIAYSLFYGNRIYKIMPNSSAKLFIITEADND